MAPCPPVPRPPGLRPPGPRLSRRRALGWAAALAAAGHSGVARAAASPEPGEAELHGLTAFGEPALPAGFTAMPYADPAAPKGGALVLETLAPFDSLNAYILKGIAAPGLGLLFDSLMTGSLDEADSLYGLAARSVRVSADRLTYRFSLNPNARFHDGSRLTAADAAASLLLLKHEGHPDISAALRDLDAAEPVSDGDLVVRLRASRSRVLPLLVAAQPIFSKDVYASHRFGETTLVPPLGSGPYRVGALEPGRFIRFERVEDYWARDLPVRRGQYNFDTIRYECFRDRQPAFEAFKSGLITVHEDFTSINWARGYDFPAVADGRVKRRAIPDQTPCGAQGWWFNTRRTALQDPRIREAIGLAFDFEWTNRVLMFGLFRRTWSFFQTSPMAATDRPSPAELAWLEPHRPALPASVFGEAVMPPVSDGSGQDRALLGRAFALLSDAGCRRDGPRLLRPDGQPFRLEILQAGTALERHTEPFLKNLRLLGIDAGTRIVDPAQQQRRLQDFDFDIVAFRHGGSVTPGEDMRATYGSVAAMTPGSRNLAGVADPVLDDLIGRALAADRRDDLTTACRAIDRVLRAGFYWVPMWHNPARWLAFWDRFGRPPRPPRFDPGVAATWWSEPRGDNPVQGGGP